MLVEPEGTLTQMPESTVQETFRQKPRSIGATASERTYARARKSHAKKRAQPSKSRPRSRT